MRIGIFGVGAAATVLAIQVDSIYDLFVLCSDFVYVMLFPQLTCVVYFRDVNTYGSLAGYIMGLFFRLAGGEKSLKLPVLIHYPWYDAKEHLQRFPFKTFSMLTTFFFILFVSYFTKYIFDKGWLQKKYDIFKCVVNIPECTSINNMSMENPNTKNLKTDNRHETKGHTNEGFGSQSLGKMSTDETVDTRL